MSIRTAVVMFVLGGAVVVARRWPEERAPRAGPIAKLGVDLNHASRREIESLPGVGPSLAARIVQTRESLPCGFRSMLELDDIPGVGPATMRRLTPLVRFERRDGCE